MDHCDAHNAQYYTLSLPPLLIYVCRLDNYKSISLAIILLYVLWELWRMAGYSLNGFIKLMRLKVSNWWILLYMIVNVIDALVIYHLTSPHIYVMVSWVLRSICFMLIPVPIYVIDQNVT